MRSRLWRMAGNRHSAFRDLRSVGGRGKNLVPREFVAPEPFAFTFFEADLENKGLREIDLENKGLIEIYLDNKRLMNKK
ncbi:MAG TPA: hypothetical protein VFL96_16380 [Acidobacteriaceae bacterium]|nr:hypothetical protein [Acidobacteriaceae bacterium]